MSKVGKESCQKLTISSLKVTCKFSCWLASKPSFLARNCGKNCLKNALKSTLAMWKMAKTISSLSKSWDLWSKTWSRTVKKWVIKDSVKTCLWYNFHLSLSCSKLAKFCLKIGNIWGLTFFDDFDSYIFVTYLWPKSD